MSVDQPPAILLGAEMTALAVARSLSRAGVRVVALGDRRDPLRYSRRRDSFVAIGKGDDFQAGCMAWLEAGPGEGVILPCNDEGLELVARNRSRLAELGYSAIEAEDEVLLAMLDKQATYEIARKAGIEAPRTATVSSAEDARQAAAEIGYPCALKPRQSHRFARHFSVKAFVVGTERELIEQLERIPDHDVEMIVTEIIPGPDREHVSYYGYMDGSGDSLLHLTKRKVRNYPPRFGVGCFHIVEWLPEVAELGLEFLRAAGIRGLACPEFKRDERDGRLKLIECNHRFTMATEQLRASGADLPLFVYNRIAGLPGEALHPPYRSGLGLWYPLRDARAFLAYRRSGEWTFPAWARSLLRPMRLPAASLTDPGPSLAEAARKAATVPARLRARRE